MTTTVTMASNAEISRAVLDTPQMRELISGLTDQTLANAQALAQDHDGGDGEYAASLYREVRSGSNGRPVGAVGSTSDIALIVEFGTADRTAGNGGDRGAMPAEHILQHALEMTGLIIKAKR